MVAEDFLAEMAHSSAQRSRAAQRMLPLADLEQRVRARLAVGERPRPLSLSPDGFDVIAEVKFSSPSAGKLAATASPAEAAQRARDYAAAGACAISVLTEPRHFRGSLDHLRAVAAAVDVPVMRKDFLVDPYQVWEAREAGASGVLLIARILDDRSLAQMVRAAHAAGMFVLLEAFDKEDLERTSILLDENDAWFGTLLVGVNGRDLATLEVDPDRHLELAPSLPWGIPAVAESGLADAFDAARARRAGYELALVGTALMRAADPWEVVGAMRTAGAEAQRARE